MLNKLKAIKPLIIGLGVAGKRHLETQLGLGIKTGIYSTNPQTRQYYRKKTNIIVFDNLEDAIDWSNLVHICTPDNKHTEFVAIALKKRKAVLCEKSFTTSFKDALYLQNLALKHKSILIVGQNYRLTPTFAETRKKVMDGLLGKITNIQTDYLHDADQYQQRKPSRKNEDFLYIGGSHAVDLAYWIMNDQIVTVRADSKNELSYKIAVKFSSGISGQITLDASSPQLRNGTNLIVEGEKGQLSSHNKVAKLLYKNDKTLQTIKLPNNKTFTTNLEVEIVDDYLSGNLNSFSPLPGVREAVQIIKVLDAIQKSALSNQEISL